MKQLIDVMMPNILYQDHDLLVCEKPAGMPSQSDPSGQADLLSTLLFSYPTVKLVHRLDTPTGGVMVFGLTASATARLNDLVQDHERFCKEYVAVVPTLPDAMSGELRDHLFHDKRQNKSFAVSGVRKGAKAAMLTYRVLATDAEGRALLLIRLHTGRTHQIRVQFSSRGLPLIGDGKYGSREKCPYIALWSCRMSFSHPISGAPIRAISLPDTSLTPWSRFSEYFQEHPHLDDDPGA